MSLAGKTICFTGTLSMKRAEATKKAEEAGATVGGSVTGKTNILIAGPGAGAKAEQAKAKGVDVWTEEEFVAAVSGGGGSSGGAASSGGGGASKAAGKKKAAAPAAEAPAAKKAKAKAEPAPPASPVATSKKADSATPPRTPGVDRVARNLGLGAVQVYLDFDAKLNQTVTDGDVNSNKFYIVQVLQKGSLFACWNRWGRVGEDGQTNANKLSWGPLEAAVKDFEKKFKDKSANNWANRAAFVKKAGKYQIVEVEDDGDGDAASGAVLGKLTREQIEKGQLVLGQVRSYLEASGAVPSSLTNDFYSNIPTVTGRAKPPPIDNLAILGEKEALLEFWLRMGFEEMTVTLTNPLEKLGDVPEPADLDTAAKGISDAGSIASSLQRGAQLAEAQLGAPTTPMGVHKYAAIVLYTGNSIYRSLNEALRIKHANVPRYLPYVKLFLAAAECMPKKPATLWRGIAADLYDEYEEGKVITWWTVSSTTASEDVARGFMSQLGGKATLLSLETTSAMNIEPLSVYPHERESLLVPGTKLQVISRARKGAFAEIRVREVGNALLEN